MFLIKNRFYILIVFIFLSTVASKAATTSLQFYSETLSLDYNPSMILNVSPKYDNESIAAYYKNLEKTNYSVLLQNLQSKKTQLGLNDWLYYELLNTTIKKLYRGKSKLQQTLTSWFLLSKSGYDTRITYLNRKAFLYIYTKDNLFEVPMIEEKGRYYINLTNLDLGSKQYASEVYVLDFIANPSGKPFSFYLKKLPKLSPNIKLKKLNFTCRGERYAINAKLDNTIVQLMKDYPLIDEMEYLKVPLSDALNSSIIPQLSRIIKGKNHKEALEIIVAFTRSAFQYKEDHEYFGKSKPMIADEVFYYPYSDCEDRSALFYNLVIKLIDLPMIIMAYPDHLTIAVALDKPIGNPITYKGKNYYICDPTGPSNSVEIGTIPRKYERKSFEILDSYK